MNKTQRLSGFPIYSLHDSLCISSVKSIMSYHLYANGYKPLELPCVQHIDTLNINPTDENVGFIYNLSLATSNATTKNNKALRFDLTTGLKNFLLSCHEPLPISFFQIGKVFRGERPQANRYREFTQCDIDIISKTRRITSIHKLFCTIQSILALLHIKEFKIHYYFTDKIDDKVYDKLNKGKLKNFVVKDSAITRNVSNYNGAIFEVFVPEMDESIAGGGEYTLPRVGSNKDAYGIGIGIGVDRMMVAAKVNYAMRVRNEDKKTS